jgi:hypothetical protein
MKYLLYFCLIFLSNTLYAQCIIYPQENFEAIPENYRFGDYTLNPQKEIRSIELKQGAIAIFSENEIEGHLSGQFLTITESSQALNIGFAPKHLVVFANPDNQNVVAFENSYLKGQNKIYTEGTYKTPANFGISSLYIPNYKKVIISKLDPNLRADNGAAVKVFEGGVHLFVGDQINDIDGYIQVEDEPHEEAEPLTLIPYFGAKNPSIDTNNIAQSKEMQFRSKLGNAISSETAKSLGIEDWKYTQYNNGIIYNSITKGTFVLYGKIFLEYAKKYIGPLGSLGMPISDILEVTSYRIGLFENGVIVQNTVTNEIKTFLSKKK